MIQDCIHNIIGLQLLDVESINFLETMRHRLYLESFPQTRENSIGTLIFKLGCFVIHLPCGNMLIQITFRRFVF